MPIKNRIAEFHAEATAWRRDLHAHPELMYDTHRTAAFVAEKLRAFGCDSVTEGVGKTGVVGVIHGQKTGSGRAIGLRADMDALPIQEATGLDYASQTPGKMHACGHDGHTAMLLGAAKYLAETRAFDGHAVLIFQPAEEGGAGAKAMIEDGLMQRWSIDEVYGLHNAPGYPVGFFGTRPGALLASSDEFDITVTGKGGHAGEPHKAVDTTLAAAHVLVGLHSIVSRNVDPLHRVVLTVGTFETDSNASNIIADQVVMKGTVRTLDPEARGQMQDRIAQTAQHIAAGFGATARMVWTPGYPVTVNDATMARHAADVARAVGRHVDDCVTPILPAEDFSYMLEERPGAYLFLGNGEESAQCHHPAYNFNDDAIPFGASFIAELIERRLPLPRAGENQDAS